jgi:hypothetical protein
MDQDRPAHAPLVIDLVLFFLYIAASGDRIKEMK